MTTSAGASANGTPGERPLAVAILASVRFYRDGLACVLAEEDGIEVPLAAAEPEELRERLDDRIDVVLLDMSIAGALDAARDLTGSAAPPRVVGIAVGDGEDEVVACAQAGVAGFVSRDDSLADLLAAIRSATRGEMRCSPSIAATLVRSVASLSARRAPAPAPAPKLTRRETEIMALIDEGLSNKQIARRLCIELPTVKNHVHHILEKLDVDRRGEAVARMRAGGREV
jgi:DNA-binding NarL/FixJ family response regulator